jgi:hypothetical protein
MVLSQPGILPAEMPGQHGAESARHLASKNARSAGCLVSLASCQQKCQASRVLSQPGILPAEMPGQQGAESTWQLPVLKSCQFLVSRIQGLPVNRKFAGCVSSNEAASQNFCYF